MSTTRKVISVLTLAGLAGCALQQPAPELSVADLEARLRTNPETGLLSPVDIERTEARLAQLARLHRP